MAPQLPVARLNYLADRPRERQAPDPRLVEQAREEFDACVAHMATLPPNEIRRAMLHKTSSGSCTAKWQKASPIWSKRNDLHSQIAPRIMPQPGSLRPPEENTGPDKQPHDRCFCGKPMHDGCAWHTAGAVMMVQANLVTSSVIDTTPD